MKFTIMASTGYESNLITLKLFVREFIDDPQALAIVRLIDEIGLPGSQGLSISEADLIASLQR